MNILSSIFGFSPQGEIGTCQCTYAVTACKVTPGNPCVPGLYDTGRPYTQYLDCSSRDLCRTTIQGGCC